MEAIHMQKSMFATLMLGILSLGLTPTPATAIFNPFTPKRLAILVPFTAVLLLSSENAQALGTKAFLGSKIALYRALRQCSLTDDQEKRCAQWIEDAEADYTTRSGKKFTSENFKVFVKEFKELWDATKAAKELYTWLIAVEAEAPKN
jgi:hypothetical protein